MFAPELMLKDDEDDDDDDKVYEERKKRWKLATSECLMNLN
jgi:hypothetical protein